MTAPKRSKDSWRKLGMDLAKAATWEWIDMGLKLRTLGWKDAADLVNRARALRAAEKKGRKS